MRASLAPALDSSYLGAVAAATAALNAQTDAASSAADIEKSAYYAQSVVSHSILERVPMCTMVRRDPTLKRLNPILPAVMV